MKSSKLLTNTKRQAPSARETPGSKLHLAQRAGVGAWSLVCLALAPLAAHAQSNPNPPGQISYQGFLTDANGIPLATNNPVNYNVQFRIFNASTAGSNLWGELQVVTVDRGYFTVMLGNGSSLPSVPFTNNLAGVFSGSDASDRYLEMTVQGLAPNDPPIQPRLRLLASPYSYLASKALSVDASTAISDGNLSANVALRAGGNTFTGFQTITSGGLYMNNGLLLYNGALPITSIGNFPFGPTTMYIAANGNVGIGGESNPGFPLNFPATLGDKISLWGDSGNHFGFGIAPSTLQIFTDISASDIVFGYGESASLTETMRIKGNGNVGIGTGTTTPAAKLDVRGDVKMQGGVYGNTVFAAGGTEDLRIVRGIVRNDGTIFNGAGFTVTKNGTGSYTLNFNPVFANVPTVTVTPAPDAAPPVTATWNNGNYNNILIETWSGSSHADVWFQFIAIGGR